MRRRWGAHRGRGARDTRAARGTWAAGGAIVVGVFEQLLRVAADALGVAPAGALLALDPQTLKGQVVRFQVTLRRAEAANVFGGTRLLTHAPGVDRAGGRILPPGREEVGEVALRALVVDVGVLMDDVMEFAHEE